MLDCHFQRTMRLSPHPLGPLLVLLVGLALFSPSVLGGPHDLSFQAAASAAKESSASSVKSSTSSTTSPASGAASRRGCRLPDLFSWLSPGRHVATLWEIILSIPYQIFSFCRAVVTLPFQLYAYFMTNFCPTKSLLCIVFFVCLSFFLAKWLTLSCLNFLSLIPFVSTIYYTSYQIVLQALFLPLSKLRSWFVLGTCPRSTETVEPLSRGYQTLRAAPPPSSSPEEAEEPQASCTSPTDQDLAVEEEKPSPPKKRKHNKVLEVSQAPEAPQHTQRRVQHVVHEQRATFHHHHQHHQHYQHHQHHQSHSSHKKESASVQKKTAAGAEKPL